MHARHLPPYHGGFLSRKIIQTSVLLHAEVFLILSKTGGDCFVIGQGSPHPTVHTKRHVGSCRHLANRFLGLPFGPKKQHGLAACHYFLDACRSFFKKIVGLLEVNYRDAMTIGIYIRLGLWVPTTHLVAKMHTCVEKIFDGNVHGVGKFKAPTNEPGRNNFLLEGLTG